MKKRLHEAKTLCSSISFKIMYPILYAKMVNLCNECDFIIILAPRLHPRRVSVDVVWRSTCCIHKDSSTARRVLTCRGGEGKGLWEDADCIPQGKKPEKTNVQFRT